MILLFANRSGLPSLSSQTNITPCTKPENTKNDTILKEGELGRGFCILDEGVVEVIRDNKILNEIGQKGAIFGELSEILMYKRGASVRAKTKTKVKYFDNKLETLVAENPKFAVKMIRNLGRRLYHMNQLAIEGNTKNDILLDADDESRAIWSFFNRDFGCGGKTTHRFPVDRRVFRPRVETPERLRRIECPQSM